MPPFTAEHLWQAQRVGAPLVAPDHNRVVYTVRTFDLQRNQGTTQLWLTDLSGAEPIRLTNHPAGASEPSWAPDGSSIYFLADRGNGTQVWRISPTGGEAEQVTEFQLDVVGYKLAPDNSTLVLAFEVFPDAPSLTATNQRLDDTNTDHATGRVYEQLFVRHWDTWKDGRRNQLFAWKIATDAEPVHLMRDLPTDVPSKPFGGMEEVAISRDSQHVVFSAHDDLEREAWSTRHNLYSVPLDGSQPPTNLTPENEAWLTEPQFSPSGKQLAYLAATRPGFESDRMRLVLRDWPAGDTRVLTESWDRSIAGYTWSRDGDQLFAHADHVGHHALFAIDAGSGAVRELCTTGRSVAPADAGNKLVFAHQSLQSPAELRALDLADQSDTQLTHHNRALLAECEFGDYEQFSFSGWNNETVYGWLIKPVNFDPAKKYPLAYLIHGGPQGSFHNQFHYRWNPQVYAGAGYAAIMIDFHGSTGYGQAFTDSISHHWHDRPFEDLHSGLAAALKQYPWIDGDRVAALGASYGGYMVNWIAGNWPDRFRCLVNHDGIFSLRAGYYDTEELWFAEWEHGIEWKNRAELEAADPMNHVDKWQTPMLVIHGGRDYRLAETHGIATFTALQRRGVPSQFLHFPDENHWVLKPANSLLWHATVLAWLDRWCKS